MSVRVCVLEKDSNPFLGCQDEGVITMNPSQVETFVRVVVFVFIFF